jgi:hypothetical protein
VFFEVLLLLLLLCQVVLAQVQVRYISASGGSGSACSQSFPCDYADAVSTPILNSTFELVLRMLPGRYTMQEIFRGWQNCLCGFVLIFVLQELLMGQSPFRLHLRLRIPTQSIFQSSHQELQFLTASSSTFRALLRTLGRTLII